jgi:predicted nucleic acid-binding protein
MAADPAVVCDASVLASIAFADVHAAEARSLVRSRRLVAPTLVRYELAHVAVRSARASEDEGDRVARAYAAALRVPVRLLEPSWPAVFALARTHGLSAYDASYLQIAVALRLPLATLDDTLARAANRLGLCAPAQGDSEREAPRDQRAERRRNE